MKREAEHEAVLVLTDVCARYQYVAADDAVDVPDLAAVAVTAKHADDASEIGVVGSWMGAKGRRAHV